MVQVNHQTEIWQLSIVDTEGLEPESGDMKNKLIIDIDNDRKMNMKINKKTKGDTHSPIFQFRETSYFHNLPLNA